MILPPDILESYQKDALDVQTVIAQLAQISASVYQLDGKDVLGAELKASAISVIGIARASIASQLTPHIRNVLAALAAHEAAVAALNAPVDDLAPVFEDDEDYPDELLDQGDENEAEEV